MFVINMKKQNVNNLMQTNIILYAKKKIEREESFVLDDCEEFFTLPPLLYAELRKHGNLGNKFLEPMSVFRNQVIRQKRNISESVKLSSNKSKKGGI